MAVISLRDPTSEEPTSTSRKLLEYLSFTPHEQEALMRGEITSHAVNELSDKELAITMAVLVPAPLENLLDFIRSGRALETDRDLLAHGELHFTPSGDVDPTGFSDVGFAPSEESEIRALLEVKPGSWFNLSESESKNLASLRQTFDPKGCEKNPRCAEAVASTLRNMLRERLAAYRERGLSGIEPYTRGGGQQADPAEELRKATNAARFLAHEYPQIFDAFLNYPRGNQSGMESRFFWLKLKAQDRPTFILSHRVLCLRGGVAFAAERQFYVGHSYNSLQILAGLIPIEGRTLLVYLNRTSTDQVAGFMSGTRHGMGRKMMEKGVREQFEDVLAQVDHQKN